MKLAEALVLRADHQKRLEQLKDRLLRNARVQEGDKPSEDPQQLIDEYESTAQAFQSLIQRINLTNASAQLGTQSLTAALAERDTLRLRQGTYRDLAHAASVSQSVISRSEVRFRSTVSVPETQKRVDELSKQLRELDATIQEANWRIELAG